MSDESNNEVDQEIHSSDDSTKELDGTEPMAPSVNYAGA